MLHSSRGCAGLGGWEPVLYGPRVACICEETAPPLTHSLSRSCAAESLYLRGGSAPLSWRKSSVRISTSNKNFHAFHPLPRSMDVHASFPGLLGCDLLIFLLLSPGPWVCTDTHTHTHGSQDLCLSTRSVWSGTFSETLLLGRISLHCCFLRRSWLGLPCIAA